MPNNNLGSASITTRYLMALAILLIFIIALFFVDSIVTKIINLFFPALDSYIIYAWQASNALIGVLGTYIIYRILISIINIRSARIRDPASGEVLKLTLRVLASFAGIAIVLTAFGVSPSEALAGGAVGGVIIGLAVQTVATSILSGFLVSSSRTLIPGDIAILKSSYWGSTDLLVKITHTSTLYTDGVTQNGNTMKFPNPLLLSSTILTQLKQSGGGYMYILPVVLNSDIPVVKAQTRARAKIADEFKKKGFRNPEIVFVSKGAPGVTFNTFNVLIRFDDISQINGLIEIVNNAFDEAYWSAKK